MGETKIEWCSHTWNPISGCTKISTGCKNCFAERMSKRLAGRCGYPKDDPFKVTLHPDKLEQPLRWAKPRKIFVNSMSDLFHDDVDEKFIAKVFAIMDLARQHTYMILTKRPERAAKLLNDEDFQFHIDWFQSQAIREFGLPEPKEIGPFPFKNVWIGVSVENQATADERIPLLLQMPAVVRFISAEPLLGKLDLSRWLGISRFEEGAQWVRDTGADLDLVITGGESGPGARPMHPDWARSLRDQCQAADVPYFFKQFGEWAQVGECGNSSDDAVFYHNNNYQRVNHNGGMGYHGSGAIYMQRVGKEQAGRLLDGRTWDETPTSKNE